MFQSTLESLGRMTDSPTFVGNLLRSMALLKHKLRQYLIAELEVQDSLIYS